MQRNLVESLCESQSVRTHQSSLQTFTDTEDTEYKSSIFNNTSYSWNLTFGMSEQKLHYFIVEHILSSSSAPSPSASSTS